MKKSNELSDHENFHMGVLVALGIVYDFDHETVAAEIVSACGTKELLRLAKSQDDPCLKKLRATARELNRKSPKTGN
jgi:hypothetical protein